MIKGFKPVAAVSANGFGVLQGRCHVLRSNKLTLKQLENMTQTYNLPLFLEACSSYWRSISISREACAFPLPSAISVNNISEFDGRSYAQQLKRMQKKCLQLSSTK